MHELLDGELDPEAAATLREHLQRCPACRARVERLERFLTTVRRQRRRPVGLPDTLRHRLREIARSDRAPADGGTADDTPGDGAGEAAGGSRGDQ